MNIWALIAPVLVALPALGLWIWLADPSGRLRLGLRAASAWVAVAWAAFASLMIEFVSLGAGHNLNLAPGGHLSRTSLALIWALPAIGGAVVLWRRRSVVRELAVLRLERTRALRKLDRWLAAFPVLCIALVAFVALVAAPTTWDSMVYHLARAAAWLQLGGVSHYATHAQPQLFQPPGSEYLIAQMQALVGGDRWAAFVQTVAYALAIGGASLVAKRLGGGTRAQLLAAFLVATAPMAILQGSSTQNDLLVGIWLLIAASQALALLTDEPQPFMHGLVAAGAVALAVLTKGTAWIYLPPVLILLLWGALARLGAKRTLALAACGLAIVFALNAGQWERNHQTFGTYLVSGSGEYDFSNDTFTPAAIFSNTVRSAALYIATPSDRANEVPADAIRSGLEALGIDPSDPATTFPGLTFTLDAAGPGESNGPSPLLFALGIWSLLAACFVPRLRTRLHVAWALLVFAQVALFIVLIKWQIWHTRLHLPALLTGVPLIAVTMEAVPQSRTWRLRLTVAVVTITTLLAPIYLLLNVDRPVFAYADHHSILTTPREQQYFAARPELERPYLSSIEYLNARGIDRLAFYGGFDDWFYPFNALMSKGALTSYVFVANPSAKYPQPSGAQIEAVACMNCDAQRQATLKKLGLTPVPDLYVQPPGLKRQLPAPFELWVRAGR